MCRFYTINTPTECVPFDYVNMGFSSGEGSRTLACFGEENNDEYDDDEEEYEKEWCD